MLAPNVGIGYFFAVLRFALNDFYITVMHQSANSKKNAVTWS
jgi:hypothetical protein